MNEELHELLKPIEEYYEGQNFDTHIMGIDEELNVCSWRHGVKTTLFSLKKINQRLKELD